MTHSNNIVLVGAAHIDRYGRCDGPAVTGASNPGRFTNMPGGAAFNVASSLHALGAQTCLYTILGNDSDAAYICQQAAARGIALRAQTSPDLPTATYSSIIDPDGALLIALADMAIYEAFDPTQVEDLNNDNWLLIDANVPADAIGALLADRSNRVAAMTVSHAKAERLRPHLGQISILFTNRIELSALCNQSADAPMDLLVQAFRAMGGRNAVITDGSADIRTVEGDKTLRHPVPQITDIVDVTGAGDALTAGCLISVMADKPIHEAVPFGMRCAQAVLAVHGPWRPDLETALA